MTAQKMLIAYAVLSILAIAMLIWALNQHVPQTLCCVGTEITR